MRRFIALLVMAVFAMSVLAQSKIYRIAVLERESAESSGPNFAALKQGFRELGYVERENLTIEYRSADGRNDRYPQLCAEVVAMKVDLIVVRGTPPTIACKKATATIPIIFAGAGDHKLGAEVRRRGWPALVRQQQRGGLSQACRAGRQDLQGHETRRHPGGAAEHLDDGDQSQDREGHRHEHPEGSAVPRRPRDPIITDVVRN